MRRRTSVVVVGRHEGRTRGIGRNRRVAASKQGRRGRQVKAKQQGRQVRTTAKSYEEKERLGTKNGTHYSVVPCKSRMPNAKCKCKASPVARAQSGMVWGSRCV